MRDLVHVRFFKWPDRLHWRYDMFRLGTDEHGVWLGAPESTVTQRGDEPPNEHPYAFVKLVPRGGWFTAIWNTEGKYEIYIDISTPPVWDGDTVEMIDLDLDVVRWRTGGSAGVLDEDEFLEHQETYGYPQHIIDKARATTASLMLAVEARDEPFGDVGPAWLQRFTEGS
jgi:protein associated with RNAse G/E